MWHPALANTGTAVAQLGLGVLILWKPTARIGLALSAAWALFVWYIGEGLSGLASGHAVMLMGSPGAAVIYALLALGVLPYSLKPHHILDKRPAYWLLIAWVAIWVLGAIYQVLPGQNTVADISSMIATNAQSAPHWLASIDNEAANWVAGFGTATSTDQMPGMPGMKTTSQQKVLGASTHKVSGFWLLLLLAILQLVIAFGVIVPGAVRWVAVWLGSMLSLCFWVVGQSLGAYYSGVATDPNTGPLLILLGIAALGCTQHDSAVRGFLRGLKDDLLEEFSGYNENWAKTRD
jgi:hypothetical protein